MSPTGPTKPEHPCGVDAATAYCYPYESQRIGFICARDGITAAVDFCWRTGHIYRAAVLASSKRGHHRPHFASLPEYRAKFIGSYLDFKRFYLRHGAGAPISESAALVNQAPSSAPSSARPE